MYKKIELWFQEFLKLLSSQLQWPVFVGQNGELPLPHVYLEWTPGSPTFNKLTGTLSFYITDICQNDLSHQRILESVRLLLSKPIQSEYGFSVFKETKIAHKTDKKSRCIVISYQNFIHLTPSETRPQK